MEKLLTIHASTRTQIYRYTYWWIQKCIRTYWIMETVMMTACIFRMQTLRWQKFCQIISNRHLDWNGLIVPRLHGRNVQMILELTLTRTQTKKEDLVFLGLKCNISAHQKVVVLAIRHFWIRWLHSRFYFHLSIHFIKIIILLLKEYRWHSFMLIISRGQVHSSG